MNKLFQTENKVKVICDNGQDITYSSFIKENKDYQPKFINVTNNVNCRHALVYLEIEGNTYGVPFEAIHTAINNVQRAYSSREGIK